MPLILRWVTTLIQSVQQGTYLEANIFLTISGTRNLHIPMVYYFIHMSKPPLSKLIQINPVHVDACHFLKMHFNIVLPFTPRFSKCTLIFGFFYQNPICSPPPPPPN
jgi:hypothetical protein